MELAVSRYFAAYGRPLLLHSLESNLESKNMSVAIPLLIATVGCLLLCDLCKKCPARLAVSFMSRSCHVVVTGGWVVVG